MHFMLLGLKEPLEAGTQFPFTLHFERAGGILIEVVVSSPGAGDDHEHLHH
jgi:copper(I)-binding protein